jgi:hypothetical protein
MMDKANETMLRSLIEQVKTFQTTRFSGFSNWHRDKDEELTREDGPLFQLYAGLGVLVRDMYLYLKEHDGEDAALFNKVVLPIIDENQEKYPTTTIFQSEVRGELPEGFATAAVAGHPTLAGLGDWRIIREPHTKPGKRVLNGFIEERREKLEELRGPDGPYEQFRRHQLDEDELNFRVANVFINDGFPDKPLWLPLTAYLTVGTNKKELENIRPTAPDSPFPSPHPMAPSSPQERQEPYADEQREEPTRHESRRDFRPTGPDSPFPSPHPMAPSSPRERQESHADEPREETARRRSFRHIRPATPDAPRKHGTLSDVPSSATPGTINRYPDVSLRDKVALHKRCTLRVGLTRKPVRKELESLMMAIEVPAGAKSVAVDVLVTAEDFEISGDDYRSLNVPVNGDPDPILFQMIPQSIGEKKVKVEFFQDSRYIGGVTTSTTVVVPEEATDAKEVNTQGVVGFEGGALPPDLTLLISESKFDGDRMRYKFKLHSPNHGLFYHSVGEELSFSGSPSKWMESLYKELGRLGEDASPEDVMETLSTIGSDLYEKLFPRELKEIWQEHIKGNVESIMIISDEPWIPWEIVKPSYESETGDIVEDDFLCGSYLLTRWIAGQPPPSRILVSHGALIAPIAHDLPNVAREVTFLKTKLGNVEEIEPRLTRVRRLLRSGGYHLLHFACHGSFDPEEHEQSVVYLEGDDKLKSRDIAGERRNFGKDRPFVFINACQTARADFSLVGIGSWADKFIQANSSGFLGSSWEVNDRLAYRFSEAFYSALHRGKTIGEAVREARTEIRGEPDPTWLAYTLYADPLARVTFS